MAHISSATSAVMSEASVVANKTNVAELNRLSAEDFVAALGHIFEHSPWIAEQAAHQRPFADADALHGAMMQVLLARPRDEQIAFLRLHPRLSPSSMRNRAIAPESLAEQTSAGLGSLDDEIAEKLDALNERYEAKFGFPFIIAARRNTIETIVAALERRLTRDAEAEVAEALSQISTITRIRLDGLVSAG